MSRGRGLYKRGDIWWIRYSDLCGVIRRESSGSTSHEVATNLLDERRNEKRNGKDSKNLSDFTFGDLCTEYERGMRTQTSFETKRLFMKKMKSFFGDIQLMRFNTKLVEQFRNKIIDEGRKPATANRYIACLKHMFTKAEEYEMVDIEVLQKVRRVKLLPENNKRQRFLSRDECKRLISACTDDIKPVVIVALNTGMRKSEILRLEWNKNIDLVHNLITINKTKNNCRRDIPINGTVKQALTGLVKPDQIHVFVRKNGLNYKTINKRFWQTTRKAGLDDFHFHDLRHTFASQLVMAGVDIMTVKELLGHKSLTMTMRYSHLSPEHKSKAIDVLTQVYNEEHTE